MKRYRVPLCCVLSADSQAIVAKQIKLEGRRFCLDAEFLGLLFNALREPNSVGGRFALATSLSLLAGIEKPVECFAGCVKLGPDADRRKLDAGNPSVAPAN